MSSEILLTQTGPVVTDADVRRFERELDLELPEDYGAFLLKSNGGYAPRSHCVFRLRKGTTVLNSFYSLNATDDTDDLREAQLSPEYPENNLSKNAIAIGHDGFGSRIVLILAGEHRGEVWFLDTLNPAGDADPRVDWFHRPDVIRLAGSFREFIESLGPLEDLGASAPP